MPYYQAWWQGHGWENGGKKKISKHQLSEQYVLNNMKLVKEQSVWGTLALWAVKPLSQRDLHNCIAIVIWPYDLMWTYINAVLYLLTEF